MVRKRRDKERDSSTAEKIAKLGGAALAIGASAAFFNKSNIGMKMHSEFMPALTKTAKNIRKELAGREITAKRLDDVYRNNIGVKGQKFKALVKENGIRNMNGSEQIRINQDRANNIFGKLKNARQIINNKAIDDIKRVYANNVKRDIKRDLINKYGNDNAAAIKQIVDNSFDTIDRIKYKNSYSDDFLKRTFKSFGFNDYQKYDIMDTIAKTKEREMDGHKVNAFIKKQEGYIKDLQSKLINPKMLGEKNSNSFFKTKLKDKALTFKELENLLEKDPNILSEDSYKAIIRNARENSSKTKYEEINLLKELKEINKDGSLDDIIVDKSLRIRDGKVYSTKTMDEMKNKFLDGFSSTIPGRLLKGIDIKQQYTNPIYELHHANKLDLSASFDGAVNRELIRNKVTIGRDLYDVAMDDNGVMKLSSDPIATGGRLMSMMHGSGARLAKDMLGTNRQLQGISDNPIAQWLDLGQDGAPNIFRRAKAFLTKGNNENWNKNVLSNMKETFQSYEDLESKIEKRAQNIIEKAAKNGEYVTEHQAMTRARASLFNDSKITNDILDAYTADNMISDATINKLLDNGNLTDRSKALLKTIKEEDDLTGIMNQLLHNKDITDSPIMNRDLDNIVNRYLRDSDHASNMLNISTKDSTVSIPFLDMPMSTTNTLDIKDILKRDIVKEVMVSEIDNDFNKMYSIMANANLTDREGQKLRYLSNWGIFQKYSGITNDIDADIKLESLYGPNGDFKNFDEMLSAYSGYKKQYLEMFETLKSDIGILDKGSLDNITEQYTSEFNRYTYVKKGVGLDLIKDLNDSTKTLANLKKFGKELIAGRDDLENYTIASMFVQNSVARLIYGVEEFGLGFSAKSTGSTVDMIKNIALKRVLPVMAAYQLYDYANFESRNLTGVSITGAAANSLKNIDMASRKLAYSTGVGQAIDWWKKSSVFAEYWTGSDEFQDTEEREEWYKNGYSPVRGGRFWGFGSSSEYRGSGIQYYQPNYLKRAHSDWKEIGIYGDPDEKWKHSWIPSLRHPLSPIRAALDPYWLEKKNMDSRPYPLTGKMFSEGTPWGAVLNPTVGQLLKPVRMLPEVKRRLGHDGRDVRAIIGQLNNKIHKRAKERDMLIVDGTDIRNAEYTPYGNPTADEINIQFRDGKASVPGINYMNGKLVKSHNHLFKKRVGGLSNIDAYLKQMPDGQVYVQNDYTGEQQRMPNELEQKIYEFTDELDPNIKKASMSIIGAINNFIKSGSRNYFLRGHAKYTPVNDALPNKEEGTYTYRNPVSSYNTYVNNYYASKYDPAMITNNLGYDYARDALYSGKQLSGMYGFLGEAIFGQQSYTYRYENAGQMTSFTRGFWDSGIGGLGGGIMEIARRFFPAEDRSRLNVNPLMNNMPDWMPAKFKTGDPYAALPKGEMRMPGKGYESLNALHPDQFGEYGAFDRMKILGDIAPTSEEYKIWRNIARNTVTDPNLIKEMEDIQVRADKMSSKHEFFEYRYVKNNTAYNKGVVKSINNDGTVTLTNGEILTLAGITVSKPEEAKASLLDILSSGDHITYRTSKDAIKQLEDGIATSAVIYKDDSTPFSSQNINKTLVDLGGATRNKKDTTPLGYLSAVSGVQEVLGGAQELIAHAKIPILHNKFFRIETALESYKNEQVYGTSFSTWDHPIEGFVKPMFNQTFGQSPLQHAMAIGSVALHYKFGMHSDSKLIRGATRLTMATLNPAAMFGGTLNFAKKLNFGGGAWDKGARYGALAGTIGWGIANADNPIKATTSFAVAGYGLTRYLKNADGIWGLTGKKGAAIGAAIGFSISALKNPRFDKDKMFGKWIPKKTRKKWELDEYFDRLEYIKYKGLYNAAAFRATILEGSNIKAIFKKLDKNKKKLAKLQRESIKVSNKYIAGSYEYNQEMMKIEQKRRALQESQKIAFKGGKYTRAAIAYKKAAESTIYGLSESATPDEILAAVPDQYKDHFKAFIDERSKAKRKEILKYVPDYLKRPLQIAWGEKPEKVKSNRRYFSNKKMPGIAWKGWKPNINLKHVKMKTIENEGMILSDFGYYESEKSKASYQIAPDIEHYDRGSGIGYRAKMLGALNGLGVSISNISLEQTSAPGMWIVGDVNQTVNDAKKVTEYALGTGIQSLVSTLF